MKRISALIVALIILLSAYPPVFADNGIPEWAGAYTWFLTTEQYRYQSHSVIIWDMWGTDEPRLSSLSKDVYVDFLGLHDMNGDNIPELLIHYLVSGDPEGKLAPYGCYVYTLRKHNVQCIGWVDYDLFYTDKPEYAGIIAQFPQDPHNNEYIWTYFEFRNYWNNEPSDFPLADKIGTGEIRMRFFEPRIVTMSLAIDETFILSLDLEGVPEMHPATYWDNGTERSDFREWPEHLNKQYGIKATSQALLDSFESNYLFGTTFSKKTMVPFKKDPEEYGEITFSTKLFQQPSKTAHRDIAALGILLSTAAYDQKGFPAGTNIYDTYHTLGFQDEDIRLFNYPGHRLNMYGYLKVNNFRFSIACRGMGEYKLLVITLRGTGGEDLYYDLQTYDPDKILGVATHGGFHDFMDEVYSGLQDYLKEHWELESLFQQNKIKVFITGHSLGGAAANLLGAYLMSDESDGPDIRQEDLYVYTYATPRTFSKADILAKPNTSDCLNIVNIVIDEDPVANSPVFDTWFRFGRSYVFETSYKIEYPGDKLYKFFWHHRMNNYIWGVFNNDPVYEANQRMEWWYDIAISNDPR